MAGNPANKSDKTIVGLLMFGAFLCVLTLGMFLIGKQAENANLVAKQKADPAKKANSGLPPMVLDSGIRPNVADPLLGTLPRGGEGNPVVPLVPGLFFENKPADLSVEATPFIDRPRGPLPPMPEPKDGPKKLVVGDLADKSDLDDLAVIPGRTPKARPVVLIVTGDTPRFRILPAPEDPLKPDLLEVELEEGTPEEFRYQETDFLMPLPSGVVVWAQWRHWTRTPPKKK